MGRVPPSPGRHRTCTCRPSMIDVEVDRRWWIGEGDERCPFCLQGYALEVEVRCADCDGPGCPHCVVRVRERTTTWCPDCRPAGHEEG